MLRGLWKLTWIEIKIFHARADGRDRHDRVPRLDFSWSWGGLSGWPAQQPSCRQRVISHVRSRFSVSLLIAISAVLSLVTIISIYREGGILKRLRATPLRPQTILTAHVIVKLLLTVVTLTLTMLAGKHY